MSALTKPCPACSGNGTVVRGPRRLPNGEPDKFDTIDWPVIVCAVCGGSGEVAEAPHDHQPAGG